MRNFNEIFREDVPYDNIKSHKKTGFQPLFRRYIFRKTTGGVNWTPATPGILGLIKQANQKSTIFAPVGIFWKKAFSLKQMYAIEAIIY